MPGLGLTALAIGFCAFLVAGILQIVPAPLSVLASVSPEAPRVLSQLDLAVAAGTVSRHPFSIAPALTAAGLVLFAANALLVLGCARLFSIRGARRVAAAIAIVGVALALAGIIQKPLFAGKIYGFWTPLEGGSPFGPFVNKNHFAGWMLMALPLTFGLLCGGIARAMRGVKPDWRDRLLWFSSPEANRLLLCAAGAAVMALSLVMTMSRSGIAALALAIVITGAFVMRRQRTTRRAVAIGYLLLLVIVVVGWAGADAIASQFARADWSELNGRRGPWADAIDIASRFPVVGTGLNTVRRRDVVLSAARSGEALFTGPQRLPAARRRRRRAADDSRRALRRRLHRRRAPAVRRGNQRPLVLAAGRRRDGADGHRAAGDRRFQPADARQRRALRRRLRDRLASNSRPPACVAQDFSPAGIKTCAYVSLEPWSLIPNP